MVVVMTDDDDDDEIYSIMLNHIEIFKIQNESVFR